MSSYIDKRQAELSHLKPGDEVAIIRSRVDPPKIATIERITPTGRFVVDGWQYNPDGYRRGDRISWYRDRIEIPTDESRRRAAWDQLKNAWNALDQAGWSAFGLPEIQSLTATIEDLTKGKAHP